VGVTRSTTVAARLGRPALAGLFAVTVAAASPARAQVPTGVDPRLFVIGDSVLLGAQNAIVAREAGWQVTVYAQEALSTLGAASVVTAHKAAIGDLVVVALGNNDAGNPTTFGHRIDGVMQAIGPVRRVVWINLRQFASWTPAMNQQLTAATARWPNLVVADWSARATPNPGLVYADGLHLTPAGQAAMAELIAEQVTAFGQQVSPSASTSTTTTPPGTARSRRRPGRARRHAGAGHDDGWVWVAAGAAAVALLLLALARRPRRRRAADP
jgi:lysophospholipase L1-like esterase